MFLEGTRAYEITNSPYMNEIKEVEKQPFFSFHLSFFQCNNAQAFQLNRNVFSARGRS